MVLTIDTKLKIRHMVTDIYKNRGVTNNSVINYAIEDIYYKLEEQEPITIVVDDAEFNGQVVPFAMMNARDIDVVEIEDKLYIETSDDWLCILAAENYAEFVKEMTPAYLPKGWGTSEDILYDEPTYALVTSDDINTITSVDLLYE